MDLSSSSLRKQNDGPDPAIMLFGKRIQGPSTTDVAKIKEELSPRGVDEGGVSFGTSSDEEEDLSSSSPNVGAVEEELEPAGGKAKAMGSQTGEKEKPAEKLVRCPRCNSADTKFCYFNNYNVNQPRHFCKHCQRYWTAGGTLRNVPVGAGKRKSKHSVRQAFSPPADPPTNLRPFQRSVDTNLDIFAGAQPNLHTEFSTEVKAPLPNLQLQFEPTESRIINPNPQSGIPELDEIEADPFSGLGQINPNFQRGFSDLGEINRNLQSRFSRLGEMKANLQSGSSGLGKMNANIQSGFSGLGEINPNIQSGFPGLGGIKANLQSWLPGLAEIKTNMQSGFPGLSEIKANLQSGFSGLGQNKANLHTGRPELNAIKISSHSGSNGSSEMKDHLQGLSEIKSSGLSESKAHLTGECNGYSNLCFHSDEPHLSLSNSSPMNNTEGGFNNNCLERVSCHEAHEGWSSGQVLPVMGGVWPYFYNMYWAAAGMQQQAWPHFAPLMTPQGWGLSCIGAMTTPISASASASAAAVLTATKVAAATTAAAHNTTPRPPPTAMLGTHLNVTGTTLLGKRTAQHESTEEHDGFFLQLKELKSM